MIDWKSKKIKLPRLVIVVVYYQFMANVGKANMLFSLHEQ